MILIFQIEELIINRDVKTIDSLCRFIQKAEKDFIDSFYDKVTTLIGYDRKICILWWHIYGYASSEYTAASNIKFWYIFKVESCCKKKGQELLKINKDKENVAASFIETIKRWISFLYAKLIFRSFLLK